jgi:hypothetical protein
MVVGFYFLRNQHRHEYYQFVKEDGIAEDGQALLLLFSSIVAALTARVFAKRKQRLLCLMFSLFALGVFGMFGEEISWGQRIVGWKSTGYFAEENIQAETNLHNDIHLKNILHPIIIAVSAYGTLSPFLYAWFLRRRKFAASFFTTQFPVAGFFAVCTGVYVIYQYLNPVIQPYYNGFEMILWQDLEMAETFFAVGVFCWTLLKLKDAKTLPLEES